METMNVNSNGLSDIEKPPVSNIETRHNVIERILDSLYNIRLRLVSLKIIGKNTIPKPEFKDILDSESQKSDEVSKAIDDAFKDIFKEQDNNIEESSMVEGKRKTLARPGFNTTQSDLPNVA